MIPAKWGWLGLALYVVFWDAHPKTETLSHGFAPNDPNRKSKRKGRPKPGKHGTAIAVVTWLIVTLHLHRALPDKLDPIRLIASKYPYKLTMAS